MPETDDTTADDTAEQTGAEKTTDTSTDNGAEDARITKANAEAARYRRELRAAQQKLEKIEAASMSETERAVAEAKKVGRAEALAAVGKRLARSEFRAAAAGRIEPSQLDGFLEYADTSKFLNDDGEPDSKAIEAAIKRLAGSTRTDFDGGVRTNGDRKADMNSLIRRAAGIVA